MELDRETVNEDLPRILFVSESTNQNENKSNVDSMIYK